MRAPAVDLEALRRVRGSDLQRLRELERLVANPIDPDYEAWRSSRVGYHYDATRRLVVPYRRVAGGSFTTGTQAEIIYSNKAAGTAKNTFTTEAQINDTAGMGTQAVIKAVVWSDQSTKTFTLGWSARGIISSTATPTFQWFIRFVSTAGVQIVGTAALTTLTGISNQLWELEAETQVVTMAAAGNNSTVRSAGLLSSPGGLAAPGVYAAWGGGAQPGTVATTDVTIDNTVFFDAACSASSASNGITLLQLVAKGLN